MAHIKIKFCKDGYLYVIAARNSYLGISKSNGTEFTISRFKFRNNFLYTEDHWDKDEHGTVKPLEELEKVPELSEEDLLIYLNKKAEEYKDRITKYIPNVQEYIRILKE